LCFVDLSDRFAAASFSIFGYFSG